jgi:hypothetical protein
MMHFGASRSRECIEAMKMALKNNRSDKYIDTARAIVGTKVKIIN